MLGGCVLQHLDKSFHCCFLSRLLFRKDKNGSCSSSSIVLLPISGDSKTALRETFFLHSCFSTRFRHEICGFGMVCDGNVGVPIFRRVASPRKNGNEFQLRRVGGWVERPEIGIVGTYLPILVYYSITTPKKKLF